MCFWIIKYPEIFVWYILEVNGTHNRNQRSSGKLIFNMVSTSPSNQENAGRSDGTRYHG